jgi:WD40 repeat protein
MPCSGIFPRLKKFRMSVSRTFLKGHKDSVSCLEAFPQSGLMISGSEDGSVRLWDPREKLTATRMFKIPNGGVGFCRFSNNLVTASSGASLYAYDMRASCTVIVTSPTLQFHGADDDDINDYEVSESCILLPLDSGEVKRIDLSSFSESWSSFIHQNIASVVRSLPRSDQVVTGGYDCRLCTGQLTNAGIDLVKDYATQSLIPLEEDSETANSQMVNPPFVTGLEVSPNKENAVVSLGDGSVFVLDIKKKGLDMRRPLWGGANIHASSVASVAWSSDSRSVWSVGTDSVLARMNENCISVRYPLEGYKPNSIVVLESGKVAVAGTMNDIELIDFR